METTLEEMGPFGQVCEVQFTALKDSGFGHRDIPKAAGTLRNCGLSMIQPRYKPTAKVLWRWVDECWNF